jgi:formylglycine-generating enzyme required for sulfatase activity
VTGPRPLGGVTLLLALGAFACASGAAGKPAPAAPAAAAREAGPAIDLVLVKGGCYRMGAVDDDCDAGPEERPAHEVCVADFRIGRTEVTQGQWRAVMGADTSAASTCAGDRCPVDGVSFDEVQEFLRRLNASTDGGWRLPTEAEWEYAARSGGKDETFAGGRDVARLAWFADNSGKVNHPVATKAPNGLGLYDMSGNVWEMTSDFWSPTYYASSPRENPTGPVAGDDHVVRGGCRTGGVANQRTTRRTFVNDRTKGAGKGGNIGFRLVRSP